MTPEEYLSMICPTLLTVSGYNNYITMAQNMTSSGYFGTNYNYAVALRAAHIYTLSALRNGEAGMVTQKTEGRMSMSFGGMGSISSELMMTSYGMQLQNLINTASVAGTVSDTYIYNIYLGG